MPDNKLTDNEIIKALEIYIACYGREIRVTDNVRIGNIYDLINLLQAKFIKEQNKNSKLRNERNRLQAEAYKECIEKVKAHYKECQFEYDYSNTCETLNNIYKELVGEKK